MVQEALLILLIVLILWPKPVLSAARWIMRHALGGRHEDDPDPGPNGSQGSGPDAS